MPRSAPRRMWSSACAAGLAAVAAALFWPAEDVPKLSPPIGADPPAAVSSAALSAEGERPRSKDGGPWPAAAASDEAGPAGEPMRDAVADGPGRRPAAAGDWTQAPWQAYWGVTRQETAAVPVPQALPHTYRRAMSGGALGGAVPAGRPDSPSHEEKTAAFGRRATAPAGRSLRTGAPREADATASPATALRRMNELFNRILAYRAFTGIKTWAGSSPGRISGQRAKRTLGRSAEVQPHPRVKAESRAKALKPPRWRPVLLSKLLGAKAIRPPTTKVQVPDLSRWARRIPKTGPDGKAFIWVPAQAAALETLRPPGPETASCRRRADHWHAGAPPAFHAGPAWGLSRGGGWLWLDRSGGQWWAWTAPDQPTWLWHGEHWWWRSDGVWFMLHDGEVWGYRLFGERRTEGLIHPGTGTRLEYSADGERAAMITPGDGAWLFDARSGAVLERWTEAQMPARPKPHAPRAISLPP